MVRIIPIRLVAATLGAVAFLPYPSRAQSTTTPADSPILTAPAEKKDAPSTPKRTRAISSEVAAALAAAAPKYSPPPPKPAPKPEAEHVDLREVDKPKNTIVRLPKYIVQEPKPVIFSERAIHTSKGLTDIAMKRYITETDRALNRFRIPLLTMTNEERALAMYAEDERLRNMSELKENATAASLSDAAAGTYIRKETDKTFLRSSDFGWSSGEPR